MLPESSSLNRCEKEQEKQERTRDCSMAFLWRHCGVKKVLARIIYSERLPGNLAGLRYEDHVREM